MRGDEGAVTGRGMCPVLAASHPSAADSEQARLVSPAGPFAAQLAAPISLLPLLFSPLHSFCIYSPENKKGCAIRLVNKTIITQVMEINNNPRCYLHATTKSSSFRKQYFDGTGREQKAALISSLRESNKVI